MSNEVLALFSILLLGIFAKKKNILSDKSVGELSKLIINIIFPALIINSMMSFKFEKQRLINSLIIILVGLIYYTAVFIYSYFLSKRFSKQGRKIYQFLSTFANVGYMGYPVVYSLYKDNGVFYASIYNLSHALFLWTLGILLLDKKTKKVNLKFLINPGLISFILAFMMFVFSVKLPVFMTKGIKMLAGAASPLSMIIVGTILADLSIFSTKGIRFKIGMNPLSIILGKVVFNIKELVSKKLLILVFSKLLFIPFIYFIILRYFDFDKTILGVILVISSMPCSANSVILARVYGDDYNFASKAVFLTTFLFLFTLPIILQLLSSI